MLDGSLDGLRRWVDKLITSLQHAANPRAEFPQAAGRHRFYYDWTGYTNNHLTRDPKSLNRCDTCPISLYKDDHTPFIYSIVSPG